MLGMLRRARERREERERNCPCKQTCLCHRPEPGLPHWAGTLLLLSIPLLFVILAIVGPPPPPRKRPIVVGKQVCEIVFVKTGEKCNGHGGQCEDIGYEKAVCP